MPELSKVTLSQDQATRINPGVFSGADSAGGGSQQDWSITITGGSSQTYTAPSSLGPTLTPSSNLNKFAGVTEMNLSAPITTLAGPVFNPANANLTKLVLPATASNWQLTEPTDYTTSPIGNVGSNLGIEFENFKTGNAQAGSFADINWALVASIMNMFGKTSSESKNLAIWSEGKWDRELTATTVIQGWTQSGQSGQELDQSTSGTFTKTVNGVEWTYTANNSSGTLTAKPNLYKAGYYLPIQSYWEN